MSAARSSKNAETQQYRRCPLTQRFEKDAACSDETKRNETKRNETKRNETKRNETHAIV
jgi:hypothetical protein